MAKKIVYSEPTDYFPKEIMDKLIGKTTATQATKKTAKKAVKKTANKKK